MANSVCFTSVCSLSAPSKPGIIINDSIPRKLLRVNEVFKSSRDAKFQSFEAKIKIKVRNRRVLSAPIVKQMVPNRVLNAKVPELMPLITSMDDLKLVDCVGFAGGKGRFYAGTAMELVFLVGL